MNSIKNLDASRLFRQLRACPSADEVARDALVANVRFVVSQSEWITSRIVQFLPQYTLHDGTHLFNVLSLMEELLPETTLPRLTPLECGLCIMAAFMHDLGMALSEDEHRLIYDDSWDSPARREFVRFREDRFPSEQLHVERLRKLDGESSAYRARLIEGHILAEYIRHTHADKRMTRLCYWIRALKTTANNESLFRYGPYDFEAELAHICVSRNQDTGWYREDKLQRTYISTGARHDDAYQVHPMSETVNLAFPGLLLRLADYMDFDASRAPSILFHHFGIEDVVSVQEWQKHLAITGWAFLPASVPVPEVFRYEALACPHPVCEKTIREFLVGIDQEIRRVADELALQNRHLGLARGIEAYALRLPERVEARVLPASDENGPTYIYHDMTFELDQNEILQLLMGESLYGDPGLCLRELVQNSLDALHMRQLRLEYRAKLERTHIGGNPAVVSELLADIEPTDLLAPGEELAVTVTWGRDAETEQEYIRIRDNGTGMSRRVLEGFYPHW